MLEPPKPVEEPKPIEEPKESKNIKTVELVECPDCHKKLTQRTLKYSHQQACPAKNPPQEQKIKKPTKKQEPEPVENIEVEYMGSNPVGPVIQRIQRVDVRKERFKHLVANAI